MKNGTTLNVTKTRSKDIPYIRISAGPQRDVYVHRLVAEALLRRPLKPEETVDHKNRQSLDCAPWNLQVLSWSNHSKLTNYRRNGSVDGIEGVDYEVILDGEKVFQRDKSRSE